MTQEELMMKDPMDMNAEELQKTIDMGISLHQELMRDLGNRIQEGNDLSRQIGMYQQKLSTMIGEAKEGE